MFDTLLFEKARGIAWITLNRPQVLVVASPRTKVRGTRREPRISMRGGCS